MSPDEREALLAETGERFPAYDPRAWRLRRRVEQLAERESSYTDATDERGEEGEAA